MERRKRLRVSEIEREWGSDIERLGEIEGEREFCIVVVDFRDNEYLWLGCGFVFWDDVCFFVLFFFLVLLFVLDCLIVV